MHGYNPGDTSRSRDYETEQYPVPNRNRAQRGRSNRVMRNRGTQTRLNQRTVNVGLLEAIRQVVDESE